MKKRLIPYIVIFNVSGLIYILLELLWRGRSHWTMFVCALMCSTMEFFFGIIFNGDFSIWDYRGLWGTLHVFGDQVNILFFGVWILISVFALPFLDWMEWKLGLEGEPYYRIGYRYWYPWEEKE